MASSTVDAFPERLEKLRTLFDSGVTRTAEWRVARLRELQKKIVQHEDEMYDALKKDLGRPEHDTLLAEYSGCLKSIKEAIDLVPTIMKPQAKATPILLQPGKSWVQFEPKGVVLNIASWNYPVLIAMQATASALAAGNTVVVKPSEVSVHSCELIVKILTGIEGIETFEGDGPATQKMLETSKYDHIVYTGSGQVAKSILKCAAEYLTPCTLELGGKSPVIYDGTIAPGHVKTAMRRLAWGKHINGGQVCVGPDYILCLEDKVEEVTSGLMQTFQEFYGEDVFNSKKLADSPYMAKVINERHFDRIMRMLNEDHGGKVLSGGVKFADRKKCHIPITMVLNPKVDSLMMKEEIFGPVFPIITVPNVEATTEFFRANPHLQKPLAMYLFSSDSQNIEYWIQNLAAGGVTINDTHVHFTNGDLPFGGTGPSGTGRLHGIYGIQELSHEKACFDHHLFVDFPMRYPPFDSTKTEFAKDVIRGNFIAAIKGIFCKKRAA